MTVSIRKNPEKEGAEAPATDSDESIAKVPPPRPPPPGLAPVHRSSSTQPLLAAADRDDDEGEEDRSEGEHYIYITAVVPHSLAGEATSHLL